MPHTPTLSEPRVRSTVPDTRGGALSADTLLHQSDERLVALTRGGSERAFSEITRRYQRQLRAYCSRIVGVERAQDAVQQALLQAFLALRDGAPRELVLRPWLYRIAHNCAVDLLRTGSWDYEQLDLEYDGVPQPPALFEQREQLRGLVAGISRLPDAQRRAITLRELEGCSYEEISRRLGHTGSGVRQLIFRARTTLRKGAAALLVPFGVLRERLVGMTSAVETHQVAGVAAGPGSGGGTAEAVGAAALAVLAVVGGVAGGIRGGGSEPRPSEHRAPARTSAADAARSPAAGARADGRRGSARLRGRRAAGGLGPTGGASLPPGIAPKLMPPAPRPAAAPAPVSALQAPALPQPASPAVAPEVPGTLPAEPPAVVQQQAIDPAAGPGAPAEPQPEPAPGPVEEAPPASPVPGVPDSVPPVDELR